MTNATPARFAGWTCPIPLRSYPTIVMGHGSGGRMMADLIQHLFAPLFGNELLAQMGDSTTLTALADPSGAKLAISTDTYVVSPLFFPGGNIGDLAINGTVNDLAMSGAQPLYLSAGFILEEGLPLSTLGEIAQTMTGACQAAGVQIVAGDTKVVNRGHGDGLYINTTGIGIVPAGRRISPSNAVPGDVVLISGTLGDHGMAIMSVREGLSFETEITSDTAPLNGLVETLLAASPRVHCLRDATRGGLAAVLNELAAASQVGIELEESSVPVSKPVQAACEILGLDPLYVANEGKLVAIVPEADAEIILAAMHTHALGRSAARIGRVVAEHPGLVVARTTIGGSRVVDMPPGELLPRIC